MTSRRAKAAVLITFAAAGSACACAFDSTLHEYLGLEFWMPFRHDASGLFRGTAGRLDAPFAGMTPVEVNQAEGNSPLSRLRLGYQKLTSDLPQLLSAAKGAPYLSGRDREEIDLIDAKILLQQGESESGQAGTDSILAARRKFQAFLTHASTPEFRSEARGWLGRTYYLLGEQASAGKIYIDELSREDSNLSRQTLLSSLHLVYSGGRDQVIGELDQYFDSANHASLASHLLTDPHGNGYGPSFERDAEDGPGRPRVSFPYERVKTLLENHASLFTSSVGAKSLAILGMRTALRAGDPAGALQIARKVPPRSRLSHDPDFLWMKGSAAFLSKQYADAVQPLETLAGLRPSPLIDMQRAAAAYALCGVNQKLGNRVEAIRWILTLNYAMSKRPEPGNADFSVYGNVYWAYSGFDLGSLLDSEATIPELQDFLVKYPSLPNSRLVRYSLAVRLARENRFAEAATAYGKAGAQLRAERMGRAAVLYASFHDNDPNTPEGQEAAESFARFLSENEERVYFNDRLWNFLQNYALYAGHDSRLTRAERDRLIVEERRLRDAQEERWQAYLLLRPVIAETNDHQIRTKAILLSLNCLALIRTDRFGREDDIAHARTALLAQLRKR